MNFSIEDFFSKYDQIRRKLQIWSHIPKKSFMENFLVCVVRRQNNPESFSLNPYKVMWEFTYDFLMKISNEAEKFTPGNA